MGTAEPFSFQDPSARRGYEVDICKAVADSLGVPRSKLIAVEARIPERSPAASTWWRPAWAGMRRADRYSHQHFVSLQKVLAREGSGTEVARRTGWQARQRGAQLVLGQGARKYIPNVEPVTFKDPSGAFLALQQGKVSGFVGSS